jgi:hypothetical protein
LPKLALKQNRKNWLNFNQKRIEENKMSGVIMEDGTQWEHCNKCGKFVEINHLFYQKPDEENKYGLDLCLDCCIELGFISKNVDNSKTIYLHKFTYLSVDEDKIQAANYLLY